MAGAVPTSELQTDAEKLRRAALKRELSHALVGGDALSASQLLDATGVDASLALVRQLADELVADNDDLCQIPQQGSTPRRYRRRTEVAADD